MNNKNKIPVMIVYAIDINSNNIMNLPWIYGVYTDHLIGFEVQEKMQSSKEYNHLYWDNKIVLLDKEN